MLNKRLVCALGMLGVCGSALADYTLVVWSATDPNGYQIVPPSDVVITRAGAYSSAAYNNGNAAEINSITVLITDPNYAGVVTVHVIPDPNDPNAPEVYGASDLAEITLTGENVVGNIGELRVADAVGAGGDTYADAITGPFVAGSVVSPMHFGVLDGQIECEGLGDVFVTDSVAEQGAIIVNSWYAGTIELAGSGGWIAIANGMSGHIETSGELSYLWVGSLLSGSLDVGDDLITASIGNLAGGGDGRARPSQLDHQRASPWGNGPYCP